jgi:uncharacterized protein (UPF0210 family)
MNKIKKKTATISELVKNLEAIKKEVGDAKVYVVHMPDVSEGDMVEFNGLSETAAIMKVVQGDHTGVLLFQSDEILRP